MNIHKLILPALTLCLMLAGCYKDKGNYEYQLPEEPEVIGLDSVYAAIVGDSLVITPEIHMQAAADLELEWRIGVPETGSNLYFTGPALHIIFGLQAKRYDARLTVYNKANGMKYFHTFFIDGKTEFANGTSVLSVENGVTQFSFIKPDGTVQARLYEAMQGRDLPPDPLSLFYMVNQQTGNTPLGYWIICKAGGIRLDVNTMQEHPLYPPTLAGNFFSAPDQMEVGSLTQHMQGVLMGVINGKFYGGTTNTWDQAATYGMFGGFAEGDYELAPSFVMNTQRDPSGATSTYFIAFDRNRRQFLRFNLYNGPTYFDTQYSVSDPSIFDPMNVAMDLIHLEQVNGSDCFAYCKGSDGIVYELKFNVSFNGPFTFTPGYKRPFKQQALINEDTKWQSSRVGVIYIASGAKVYRYNPLNEDLREMESSFDGNKVTMLKLSDDEQSLMVGAGTSIYYLDISTGKYGPTIKKIDGIPGSPVDMAVR